MIDPVYRDAAGMRRAGDGTHEHQGHQRPVMEEVAHLLPKTG
jgi:hypothetical protein